MPKFFINHPIFAWVVSILISLAGVIGSQVIPPGTLEPPADGCPSFEPAPAPDSDADGVPDGMTTDAQGQHAGSVVMLYMGCEAIVKTRTLALPLRASEVELAFNHMGETLLRIRSAKGRVAPEPGTEVHIERTASAAAAPGWLARLRARHEPVSGGD